MIMNESSPAEKPVNVFSRFFRKLRNTVVYVRRRGVPHEETIIIPAISVNLAFTLSSQGGWKSWIAIPTLFIVSFSCGAWLGLAWRDLQPFRVLLRTIYISILAITIHNFLSDDIISNKDAVTIAGSLVSTVGFTFYIGYVYGCLIRDVTLRRFASEKHRASYYARKKFLKRVWSLALDKEDKSLASDTELVLAKFVQSCFDIKGIAILFSFILGLYYTILRLNK